MVWQGSQRDRPTRRRTVKTGAATYEANQITAAKPKRNARKSQLSPPRNATPQPPVTCSRCQRTFRAPIELIGHLRANCSTLTKPAAASPFTSVSSLTPTTNTDHTPEPHYHPPPHPPSP
ncbi:hypothetical protein SprV_0200863500 [Sparganum proliferum]